MTEEVKLKIDARGSFCPGPLMELVKAIKKVEVGEVIELLSNDEGSVRDIPAWIQKTGHELIEVKPFDGYNAFIVKKGEKKSRK